VPDFKNIILNLKKDNNYRNRVATESAQDSLIKVSGEILNNFSSNNYLNLANNKKLKIKLKKCVDEYGIGSGASPLISGYSKAHESLEKCITKLLGFESTLVSNSGYLTNVGLINAISENEITIFQDKGNHNSIIESSRLSKTKLVRYKHLDYDDLEVKIKKIKSPTKIIFTDAVFSMTGEKADLLKISSIAKKHKALLFIDDAHGFGVLRENEKKFPSSINNLNLDKIKIDAYIATFGKGLSNGYPLSAIAGRADIMRLMEDVFFSFTMGGETLSLAAARATLQKINREPVIEKLKENGEKVVSGLRVRIAQYGVQHIFSVSGHPSWSFLNIKDVDPYTNWEIRTYLFQEMFKRQMLMLGDHNMSYAHSTEDIKRLLCAYDEILPLIREAVAEHSLLKKLNCKPLAPLFRVR